MITPKEAKELSASNREKIVAKETERILVVLSNLFTKSLGEGKFSVEAVTQLDWEYFEEIKRNIISEYKGYSISVSKDDYSDPRGIRVCIYW